jgi:hypothetical protein
MEVVAEAVHLCCDCCEFSDAVVPTTDYRAEDVSARFHHTNQNSSSFAHSTRLDRYYCLPSMMLLSVDTVAIAAASEAVAARCSNGGGGDGVQVADDCCCCSTHHHHRHQ